MIRKFLLPALLVPALAFGCAAVGEDNLDDLRAKDENGKSDASAEALFFDFEWDGWLLTSSSWNPNNTIEDQILYTVGHLNEVDSVSRIDKLVLTNVEVTEEDGKKKISYHASLPVAWNNRNGLVDSYTFTLPKDMSYTEIGAFADKYGHDCVSWGAHDVDAGVMWYYYRPEMSRCNLEANDVVEVTATLTPSTSQTSGKYPEYHKVWEDDVLRVVAIFGKNEDGATSGDPGITAYNSMATKLRYTLGAYDLNIEPADAPSSPGINFPDVTFTATLPDGKTVVATILLVDNVRTTGAEFDARYEELSSDADVIAYAGHSGLGANIRALAGKGSWVTGQYVVVIMNGCDTYAYVDSSLADAHAAVNADDSIGYKYMDIVTNAMPAYFSSNAENIMAFVRGLMNHAQPKTYEQIFAGVASNQVQLVSGEEDNVYVPGYDPNDPEDPDVVEDWEGLSESGTVAKNEEHRFESPKLAAGTYLFTMTGTDDADIYVRTGDAPTQTLFDCRPYRWGSNESCSVELPSPAKIHVMVRGWAASSEYELEASKQ